MRRSLDHKDKLSDDFIFINGDLIFSMDFKKLLYFHKRLSSNLTLLLLPVIIRGFRFSFGPKWFFS